MQNNTSVPTWEVYISSDKGASWIQIEKNPEMTAQWQPVMFLVSDYIPVNGTIRLKFTVNNQYINGYFQNFVEGLFDDFEIMSTSDAALKVDENPTDINLAVYPNPVTNKAIFSYFVPQTSQVSLKITNIFGMSAGTLTDGIQQGSQQIIWNPVNLAPGLYIYHLSVNGSVITGKLIIE